MYTFSFYYTTAPHNPHSIPTRRSSDLGSPDYLSKSGTLTFPAGTTVQTQTIDVLVCGDTTFERSEEHTSELKSPYDPVSPQRIGKKKIQNDDEQGVRYLNDVSQAARNS